jgi:hypothetical protein
MVIAEVLFHSIGAVIELTLMYLAFLCYTGINDGVNYLWGGKFDDDRRCTFKGAFSS